MYYLNILVAFSDLVRAMERHIHRYMTPFEKLSVIYILSGLSLAIAVYICNGNLMSFAFVYQSSDFSILE